MEEEEEKKEEKEEEEVGGGREDGYRVGILFQPRTTPRVKVVTSVKC